MSAVLHGAPARSISDGLILEPTPVRHAADSSARAALAPAVELARIQAIDPNPMPLKKLRQHQATVPNETARSECE
jgi:hypothetical protein